MIFVSVAGFTYNDTTSPQSFGREEIDILTAGVGKDIFQLWGGSGREGIHAYYDGAGNSDYALITDFNPKSDIIKLTTKAGSSSAASTVSYSLSALTEKLGTYIYLNHPNAQPELIGILPDVAPDSLILMVPTSAILNKITYS